MIQQVSTTVVVAAAGAPVRPYTAPKACAAIFVQAAPTNTSTLLVKNAQGQIVAWLAPGGGNDAAGNGLPGGSWSWPPWTAGSLGDPLDASQWELDTLVSGEGGIFVIAVAI